MGWKVKILNTYPCAHRDNKIKSIKGPENVSHLSKLESINKNTILTNLQRGIDMTSCHSTKAIVLNEINSN